MQKLFDEFAYRQHGDQSLINNRHVNGENYEILLVLSDGGNALIYNGTWPLRVGTLLFIDSAYPHCVHPQRAEQYLRNKIILSRTYLRGICELGGFLPVLDELIGENGGRCAYLEPPALDMIDRLFLEIQTALCEESPVSGMQCMAALIKLLAALFHAVNRATDAPAMIRNTDPHVEDVIHYLCRHLSEPLTIDAVSAETHVSKYHMCRVFHHETGMTIMQYLYAQRISLALRLLSATDLSMSEIAQRCGFLTPSHLCAKFRDYMGVSPRTYRYNRKNAENSAE